MSMEDTVESMAGIIPVAMMGGVALGFTNSMLNMVDPYRRSRKKPFDKQSYKDNRRGSGMEFGNFGNIGW